MATAATPVVVVNQQAAAPQDGCCRVPAGVSGAVKATRGLSIAIIIIHALALVALGFVNVFQWSASLIGIIVGSVVLCQLTKCMYIATGILYIFGLVFDVVAAVAWIVNGAVGLAVLPLIGAVLFIVGSAFALTASCDWEKAMGVNKGSSGGVSIGTV